MCFQNWSSDLINVHWKSAKTQNQPNLKKNYLSYGAQRSASSNRMDLRFWVKKVLVMKYPRKKDEVCKSIGSVWNNYKLIGFTYFTHFGLTYKLDLFCWDTSLQEVALLRSTGLYDLNWQCAELLQIGRLFLLIWLTLADFVLKHRFIVLSDGSLVWTNGVQLHIITQCTNADLLS